MKYKRLSKEELEELKPDFINFLASAQITGPDWEKLKRDEIGKAEELIDVFSDMVYDKVLRKIHYLEYRDAKSLNIFFCGPDQMKLIGLRVKEHASLDLTSADVLEQWNKNNNSSVSCVVSEKAYIKEREEEVFDLLQNGCLITDQKLFDLLSGMA